MPITASEIKALALACGFELAGIAPALPVDDFSRFEAWRKAGNAGSMGYLTDRRGDIRGDPRNLLASARTILSVGKLYNTSSPDSADSADAEEGRISRYSWSRDYHDTLRLQLENIIKAIRDKHAEAFDYKICVDTAPLLERSYARQAGLGWIGRNTCLINQAQGSWFFLGEILLSLELEPDAPPPDRCGTCRRCIDACPTDALKIDAEGKGVLDARLCISYLTIECQGAIPPGLAAKMGNHIFGCDICQDVCPWNGRAPVTSDEAFEPLVMNESLAFFSELTEENFRSLFRRSPVWRSKYRGFLRNVATAMGNSRRPEFRGHLIKLASHSDELVADAARQGLTTLNLTLGDLQLRELHPRT